MGGKTGDSLAAAHGLDSVAGGFLHKYIGLRDNWANSMIGTLWKDNYLKIEPGKIHNLIPGVNTKNGFKTIEDFFDN